MANNILFLSREFGYGNNACGICLLNLADEFVKRGDTVTVLSLAMEPHNEPYELKGIKVIEYKENWFTSLNTKMKKKTGFFVKVLFSVIQLLRLPFALLLYPRVSRRQERILYKAAKKIVEEKNVSHVIGSFSPCETTYVPMLLKKAFPQLKVVNYHLDPLMIPDNSSALINRYKFLKGKHYIEKELNYVDILLAPDSTEGIIKHNKIRYVGFPLFLDNLDVIESDFCKNEDEICMVYIGTLDKTNRNIDYTLKLLDLLNFQSARPIKLHLWGALLDHETMSLVNKSAHTVYHGTIENKFVPDLLTKADFLLNVSNKASYNAIPSKIFQLFSSRKPIINIVKHPDDFAVRYFNSYPSALSIPEYEDFDDIKTILVFINANVGIKVILSEDAFVKCRPSYICNLILK